MRDVSYSSQSGFYCWPLQQVNQYSRHNLYILNFLFFFFFTYLTEMICNLNLSSVIVLVAMVIYCHAIKTSENLVTSDSNLSLLLMVLQGHAPGSIRCLVWMAAESAVIWKLTKVQCKAAHSLARLSLRSLVGAINQGTYMWSGHLLGP